MKIYVKNIEKLNLPKRGSEVAAGYDIIATSEPKIVGEQCNPEVAGSYWERIDYIEYETNLYIAPEFKDVHTLIHPRSSISKYNLVLANSIGLVDSDYRGHVLCRFKYIWQPNEFVFVSLTEKITSGNMKVLGNPDLSKIYKIGDKIAQLVFSPTINVDFVFVDELDQTQRGSGGFGSTDVKQPAEAPVTKIEDLLKINDPAVSNNIRYSDMIKDRDSKFFK